ncbi:MAG: ATP-binding protein [Bacteroidetes bacterium]|nr:ATP-binding protein [Bacteroidota bacterium]MDA1269089.1 ATP-binding protein [Bacteroidota bacterium]
MKRPKRILILGPESTGKSTLAEKLAQHYGEPWVPEVARAYLEGLNRHYVYADLVQIGSYQMSLEDELASTAKHFLFCDTDLRVIQVWSQHRYGKVDPWVLEEMARRTYDLILLCAPDLPWQTDPLREHPELEMRQQFFEMYQQITEISGFPWALVAGESKDRLRAAIQAVETLE